MAKESSVAPRERVNITYTANSGGAKAEVELPNKMLVLGDFTMREDEELLENRGKINVNKNNFNNVMEKQNLNLNFCVANKLSDNEDEDMNVSLKIDSIASFAPDHIAQQVPELAKLMALREALAFLKGPLGNIPAFRKQLDKLLGDSEAREKLMQELSVGQ